MTQITKKVTLDINSDIAFQKFVNEFNQWWPSEYTWSKEKLEQIYIEPEEDGLCTEIGPHGFRCDWGRVIELVENESITFKWQISLKREPIPDPEKASDVKVEFESNGDSTTLKFSHFNFENHGEDGDNYRDMMASEYGWPYILDKFKKYCEG